MARSRFSTKHLLSIIAIGGLLVLTACGLKEQPIPTPTPTPTSQPVVMATMTPAPTATEVPTSTSEPPTETPPAIDTATPTTAATNTPIPAPAATITPTATAVLLMQVSEARVIYYDGEFVDGVEKYQPGVQPWMDLLVRVDDNWYGPERAEDDIQAIPLTDGYRWETDGNFSSLPNGEAWWTGPDTEGTARLIGPDGSEIHTLQLKIEFDGV
jgi:hypothetical protein